MQPYINITYHSIYVHINRSTSITYLPTGKLICITITIQLFSYSYALNSNSCHQLPPARTPYETRYASAAAIAVA